MRFIFSLLFIVAAVNSQGNNKSFSLPVDTTVNIIVGFNQGNPNSTAADIKGVIKNIPGVNKVLFCDNHSCFIINLNPSLVSVKENFTNQLKTVFPQDNFGIKDGDISGIMPFCSFNDPIDAQQTK
jgi:hypothetical protein